MFAPRPDLVASELKRVTKPGGLIAMANWTPAGFIGQIQGRCACAAASEHAVTVGQNDVVRERFGDGVSKIETRPRILTFAFPFTVRSRGSLPRLLRTDE